MKAVFVVDDLCVYKKYHEAFNLAIAFIVVFIALATNRKPREKRRVNNAYKNRN